MWSISCDDLGVINSKYSWAISQVRRQRNAPGGLLFIEAESSVLWIQLLTHRGHSVWAGFQAVAVTSFRVSSKAAIPVETVTPDNISTKERNSNIVRQDVLCQKQHLYGTFLFFYVCLQRNP